MILFSPLQLATLPATWAACPRSRSMRRLWAWPPPGSLLWRRRRLSSSAPVPSRRQRVVTRSHRSERCVALAEGVVRRRARRLRSLHLATRSVDEEHVEAGEEECGIASGRITDKSAQYVAFGLELLRRLHLDVFGDRRMEVDRHTRNDEQIVPREVTETSSRSSAFSEHSLHNRRDSTLPPLRGPTHEVRMASLPCAFNHLFRLISFTTTVAVIFF